MKKTIWIISALLVILCCSVPIAAEEVVSDAVTIAETAQLTEAMESETAEEALTEEATEPEAIPEDDWTPPSTVEGWQQYIEEELLPIITMALTVIAGIYVAISPILAKIRKASEKFKSATEDVNAATGTVKSNEKKIEQLEAALSERIECMERESAANRKTLTEIQQMLRLGLGNMNELVIKGCARSIMQIGQESVTGPAAKKQQEDGTYEAKD